LCAMFIENFQGTYQHLSTAETLKTIKQKHDESLRDYVKHFCNARNNIPHIQDIEIINAFRDGVSDIKTMEEIAMKKPKMVADLLVVADICIEASEARARLLESHGKGPSKKGMTGRSTLRNEEIRRTAEDTGTVENNPHSKRKRDPYGAPMAQKSGARSIVPMDMIWKSVKLFWITKECCYQQRRHPKILVEESIAERSLMEMSIWRKSM
jgi:hypothetical protein